MEKSDTPSGPKGQQFAQPGPKALVVCPITYIRAESPAIPIVVSIRKRTVAPLGLSALFDIIDQGRCPWLGERMARWATD